VDGREVDHDLSQPPLVLLLISQDSTRKKWSPKAMEDGMAAVKNGQMTVFHAANIYKVPKSTLHDRISGKVRHGDKPGPKPYLSSTEEKELADFLVDVVKGEQENKYVPLQDHVHMTREGWNHQLWPHMDGSCKDNHSYCIISKRGPNCQC